MATREALKAEIDQLRRELDFRQNQILPEILELEALRKSEGELRLSLESVRTELFIAQDTIRLCRENHTSDSHTACRGDHAFIDGKKYEILYKDRLWQARFDFFKNYFDENFTALVIERHGG